MKTRLALLSILLFLLISSAVMAQNDASPRLDATSRLHDFQFFFVYQLPLGFHQFGNNIGITPNDVVSQDYQDIATELQLENVDLTEKYVNNQVDDATFQSLNENIANSEDDATSNLAEIAQSTPSTDDDLVLNQLNQAENEEMNIESQAGVEVSEVSESGETGSSGESSSSGSSGFAESSGESSSGESSTSGGGNSE